MSELFSAVTSEMYDNALTYAQRIITKRDVPMGELWKHLRSFIEDARREYATRFVDYFAPHHIEQAQRELAEAIIADLWEEG